MLIYFQGVQYSKQKGQRAGADPVRHHGLWAKVSYTFIVPLFPGGVPRSDHLMSFMVSRSGRGDRIGRYGNTSNDHNFRDMDYRGYDQEDEEPDPDGAFGCDEQLPDVLDFQDHLGFLQRGDGRKDASVELMGTLWPPCPQSHPDSPSHPTQAVENRARREFEQSRPGPQDRGRGKGLFTDDAAPPSESMEGSWGHGSAHSERMEYNAARQREEDRFSREPVKRRVSRHIMECFYLAVAVGCWLCSVLCSRFL